MSDRKIAFSAPLHLPRLLIVSGLRLSAWKISIITWSLSQGSGMLERPCIDVYWSGVTTTKAFLAKIMVPNVPTWHSLVWRGWEGYLIGAGDVWGMHLVFCLDLLRHDNAALACSLGWLDVMWVGWKVQNRQRFYAAAATLWWRSGVLLTHWAFSNLWHEVTLCWL